MPSPLIVLVFRTERNARHFALFGSDERVRSGAINISPLCGCFPTRLPRGLALAPRASSLWPDDCSFHQVDLGRSRSLPVPYLLHHGAQVETMQREETLN